MTLVYRPILIVDIRTRDKTEKSVISTCLDSVSKLLSEILFSNKYALYYIFRIMGELQERLRGNRSDHMI